MDKVLAWCAAHWGLISLALVIAASILNSITRHYGERHPTIVPLFGVIVEALSLITSKGASTRLPGLAGKLKLPLQDVPSREVKRRADTARTVIRGGTAVLLLFLGTLGAGCGASALKQVQAVRGELPNAANVINAAATIHHEAIRPFCSRESDACKAAGKGREDCPGYEACHQIRMGVEKVAQGAEDQLKALDKELQASEAFIRARQAKKGGADGS